MSTPFFTIRQHEHHGCYSLACAGELDLQVSPQLEDAITRLCGAGAREIEIDLRDVTFIDSTGLRTILQAEDDCSGYNVKFFIVPSLHLGGRRAFEILGIDDTLPWRTAPSAPSV